MEQVGVEAVVDGLSSFLSNMGKINSSLDSVRSHGTLLQRAFGTIGDALSAFGSHVVRIAEYALGKLLADAVQWVTRVISDLIQTTIEAGAEFQILELRLERLNFNDLVESGMDYNDAAQEAIKLTKEQLTWIQKLAAATPYDAQDVANVYTLARSYNFSATAAQGLTETIMDFAAGMGLGSTEIQRIIVNLGQMVQQGKVTGREMTDLARGAFVPVNDILKRMQENTGLTGKEFEAFRNTGEGVNAFMEAFTQIVEERFQGASERMAQTFKGATDNMKDLVKSMVGMNVVKPILDAIGSKLSGFISLFTDNEDRWNRMVKATERIGAEMVKILDAVFGLLPEGEVVADGFVDALNGIADWLSNNRDSIVQFFMDMGDTIKNNVVPFVRDQLIPAIANFIGWIIDNKEEMLGILQKIGEFIDVYIVQTIQKIGAWAQENGPLISEFFSALGEIIAEVIEGLTGKPVGAGGFLETLLSFVKEFMTFIIENKSVIADWIEKLIRVAIVVELISTAFKLLIGAAVAVGSAILTFASAVIFLLSPLGLIVSAIMAIVTAIVVDLATAISSGRGWLISLGVWGNAFFMDMANTIRGFAVVSGQLFDDIRKAISEKITAAWTAVKEKFAAIKETIVSSVTNAWKSVQSLDWAKVGTGMISGMVQGVLNGAASLISAVVGAAVSAYEAALSALGIASPSKLFMDVGVLTMEGMAIGIRKAAGLAANAMGDAMAQVAMPAVALPSVAAGASAPTQVYNSTRNYNLSINTSASSEPIIQDFNMLESLGA